VRTNIRPCLILIVVAALGMLPAALAHGIGSDIQRPLATVVVGGVDIDSTADAAGAACGVRVN
jgi:Cu/Ag efflux pump CusA